MEKRILIAFILSFGVLYAFRALYVPPQPSAPVTVEETDSTAPLPAPPEPATTSIESTETISLAAELPADLEAEGPEEVVVEMPLYTATVSNTGGVLKSYILQDYTDAAGQPLELIYRDVAGVLGWPLGIVTGDSVIDELISTANFVMRRSGDTVDLEFASQGIHVVKSLEFDRNAHDFRFSTSVSRDGRSLPHSVIWQGGFGDQSVVQDASKKNFVHLLNGSFERLPVATTQAQQVVTTRAGVEDQYFLAMFLLPDAAAPVEIRSQDYTDSNGETVQVAYMAIPAAEGRTTLVYIGPKQQHWLGQTDPQLTAVIDYGFFEFLTRPLVFALLWIHSFVGNYGWAIVILTVIINLVLFPLRLKQQLSMQKMQKIQPQMRTLQDKYKKLKPNDPKRAQVQSEMMGLYKAHGVNPLGGCLPLVLQMPFFFAFWSMLSVSIELRQAPWILWIRDLSQHDPYFIIPILMAVSMVVMQKMTPMVADPMQAKIMMIMPVMFTVLFLWVQSGLTLYWLTTNVVGIGQQVFINKYWISHDKDKKGPSRPQPQAQQRKERRAK